MVNKISNISTTDAINLVKRTDYSTKTNEIENKVTTDHDKYITTQEYNKLLSENVAAKLKQANLASKTDIPENTDIVKKTDFDDKLKISNKKCHKKVLKIHILEILHFIQSWMTG